MNASQLGRPPLIAASRRDVKAEHSTKCLTGTFETIEAAIPLPSENPSIEVSSPSTFALNQLNAAIESCSPRLEVKIPELRPYPE
jgi:hypothetical protein